MMLSSFLLLPVSAQEKVESGKTAKSVELKEVTVKAARVINKIDGQLIVPSEAQRKAAADGYSLLGKVALPHIRVDEVMHTVTSLMNNGTVQLRLNGVLAGREELLSLDPKLVKSIDFIDNPGIRYGEGIAYVIDIRTQREAGGYTVGADLTHTLTARNSNDMFYAKFNHKNSELSFSYNFSCQDFRGGRTSETADYLLNDGRHHTVSREQTADRSQALGNTFQVKYSLADSSTYVFQATLSGDGSNSPGSFSDFLLHDGTTVQSFRKAQVESSFSPALDLYFFRQLGKHQSVTANVVCSGIYTDRRVQNGEGGHYEYSVDGRTWELRSEAVYENRLKPFTLSAGLQHMAKYTRNDYSGDVLARNRIHLGELYLFSELKGRWKRLSCSAGAGVANKTYSQAAFSYDYWTFRPKLTLGYEIVKGLGIHYTFQTYRRVSSYAMVSDARIRNNSREWTVGNPDLKPSRVVQNLMELNYHGPHLSNGIYMEYRHNLNCNMGVYERTAADQFLYSQQNAGSIRMFYVQDYLKYDLIPEHLSLTLAGGINRFFNVSSLYRHYLTSYTCSGNVQVYLGRWTLAGFADNGWKFVEGEQLGHNSPAVYFTAGYHLGNCDLSLYLQHPFQQHPRMYRSQVLNENLYKDTFQRSRDLGNMVTLNLTWRLSRGKTYKEIRKKIQQKGDRQTGIM